MPTKRRGADRGGARGLQLGRRISFEWQLLHGQISADLSCGGRSQLRLLGLQKERIPEQVRGQVDEVIPGTQLTLWKHGGSRQLMKKLCSSYPD